jgi:predicted TIM-barrel fold metal-dependent hydrolase
MYIDNHVHCEPDEFIGDPKAFADGCRQRGVEHMLVVEPLASCRKVVKMFGDFMLPIAVIRMDSAGPRDIAECIDAGCLGIKFIASKHPYADERYWPLYAKLAELKKPAVFHTGYLAPLFEWSGESPEHPVWTEHMRPMQVEVVARRFPELQIVMAHYGNPWFEEGWKVSWSKKNVYGDLCGGTAIHRSIRFWADLFAPDGELFEDAIVKLCFGSDMHVHSADDFTVDQYIRFYNRIYDAIGLSPALRELINRGNTARIFGLK